VYSAGYRRRLALVLRDWAGWPYDDIAHAPKVSVPATDRLVNNARKAAHEGMRREAA
jgi:DNA-directed RNA polymerase specialized sigma24 family protein